VDPQAAKKNVKKQRSAEDFDLLIGFFGFWAVVVLVMTVSLEVTGRPALLSALGLLALALVIWGLVKLRRTLPHRTTRRLP
jgi:cytosine/uracil/thiamine/allantoin permease